MPHRVLWNHCAAFRQESSCNLDTICSQRLGIHGIRKLSSSDGNITFCVESYSFSSIVGRMPALPLLVMCHTKFLILKKWEVTFAVDELLSTHSGLGYPDDRRVKNVNLDLGYCFFNDRQAVRSGKFLGEWHKIGGLKNQSSWTYTLTIMFLLLVEFLQILSLLH
jgi:hypothetical protein